MVAVLIEFDLRGVERDTVLTRFREQSVPAMKSQPGFESGTWLAADGTGKGLSLTLWDTQAHAAAMHHRFNLGSNRLMAASVVRLEFREVAATA